MIVFVMAIRLEIVGTTVLICFVMKLVLLESVDLNAIALIIPLAKETVPLRLWIPLARKKVNANECDTKLAGRLVKYVTY